MTKTVIEPILYHDTVTGWHHHHTEAGAIVHLDTASGHFTDDDGSTVIYSSHLADHDSHDLDDDPCLLECEFAERYPEVEQ